jgi:hypothetical protein
MSSGQIELVRHSLLLLTMIASMRTVTKRDLYRLCVRSEEQIDRELRWASREGLLVTKAGRIPESMMLNLTLDGTARVTLNWIARFGAATTDHMTRRFKRSKLQTYYTLDGLRKAGLLKLGGAMNFEPLLYMATQEGLDLVGRGDLSVLPLSSRDEGHLRAEADSAITLEAEYGPEGKHGPYWEVWHERQVMAFNNRKSDEDRLANPRYDVEGHGPDGIGQGDSEYEGQTLRRRPDELLIQRFPGSERIVVKAIEIELTNKSQEMLRAIFWAYCTCPTVDEVVYYVSRLVQNNVERAVEYACARAEREIEAGNYTREQITRCTIIPLPEALVPAKRRAPFYVPQPLAGSQELFKRTMGSSKQPQKLKLQLLNVVQWVTLNGVVTPNALDRLLSPREPRSGFELLRLAHGAGWLYHSNILREEGSMFFATEEGRNEVGLDLGVFEVDYSDDPHYFGTAALCRMSRIAADLAREFPHLTVKSRWELRGDCLFNGSKLLEVAMPGEGLGDYRHPAALVTDPAAPFDPPIAAVMIPQIQASRVKIIIERWMESEAVSATHFYMGHPEMIRVAKEFVEKTDQVVIKKLPPGSKEGEPLSDEESLTGCSLPSGTRTAWANT